MLNTRCQICSEINDYSQNSDSLTLHFNTIWKPKPMTTSTNPKMRTSIGRLMSIKREVAIPNRGKIGMLPILMGVLNPPLYWFLVSKVDDRCIDQDKNSKNGKVREIRYRC